MNWLYLRYNKTTKKWYAGRTHHENYHLRNSGSKGEFAVDMHGKEVAVQVEATFTGSTASYTNIHYVESEAIQFLAAFVGRGNVSNCQQLEYPITGFKTVDL